MSLKMKFLQGKVNDQVSYPVTTDEGVELSSGETLKEFITKITKNFNWMGNNTVTKNHLQKESVTDEKISKYKSSVAGSGIQTASIADGAITDAKILPYKLKSGSSTEYVGGLSGNKIKDGAITNEKISGGISGSKIEDGTITLEKTTFGQIDLIYSGVPVGENNKVSVTGLDQYRCLILGVTNGGPSTVDSRGNPNGGSILATIMIPLIRESEDTFFYRPFTNIHQAFFPDIKENGTGSWHTYSASFQFDSNSTSSGKVWLAEITGASYSGLVLFGIK